MGRRRHRVVKRYERYPAAHRQWRHDGHCRLIHGHNWSFEFEFSCEVMDGSGFVVDFGKLGWLREWLEERFDHTLLVAEDDPEREFLVEVLGNEGFAVVVVVPDGSAEALAEWLDHEVGREVRARYGRRGVRLERVVVWEDRVNRAEYRRRGGDT